MAEVRLETSLRSFFSFCLLFFAAGMVGLRWGRRDKRRCGFVLRVGWAGWVVVCVGVA